MKAVSPDLESESLVQQALEVLKEGEIVEFDWR
jgi:hypothetical protein